jgi:outer membrane immunogenic protein
MLHGGTPGTKMRLVMKRVLILSASLCFMAAGSASAADMDAPPPPAGGYYDWSGFYVGAFGGYATGTAHAVAGNGLSGSDTFDIEGAQYGGLAGYNFQDSWIVYGVESDIGFNDVDGTAFSGGLDDFDVNPSWHLRGRVGIAMDNFLPFLAGGVSVGDGDARIAGLGAPSQLHFGWNAGLGLDWGVTDHIVLRAEYIHEDYYAETYKYAPGDIDIDWSSNTARAAAIVKF